MKTFDIISNKIPLESFFRSIGIVFDSTTDNDDSHDMKQLKTWIVEYDDWYKTKTGITNNHNLHFLYARNIHLFINGLLSNIDQKFIDFILLAKDLGFISNLHVDISECIDNRSIIENITNLIRGISFVINSGDQCNVPSYISLATNQILELLVERNSSPVITGDYKFWKNSDIFSNKNINKSLYRFRPDGNISSNNRTAKYTLPTPCGPRFRLFVDPSGLLYPCYGLIGFERFNLGSIYESAWDNKLNDKEWRNLLFRWATSSPNLNGNILNERAQNNLPHICNLHINNIVNKCTCTEQLHSPDGEKCGGLTGKFNGAAGDA